MKRKMLVFLCAAMLLGGCAQGTPNQTSAEDSRVEKKQETVNANALGNNNSVVIEPVELSGELEKAAFLADRVYELNQSNTLVSPLSLEVALGLVAEGCSGETANELYHYLGREDYAQWVKEYMDYADSLTQKDSGKFSSDKYTFQYTLANSVWVSDKRKLHNDYQEQMKDLFRAEVQSVDFVNKKDKTAKKINDWCDKKTNGLIPEIVAPEMFTSDLSAILMNTVYFESPWRDNWSTREHEFTDIKGNTTTQEMLVDTVGWYYENENATAFSKPYYNGFLFIGILPKAEGAFEISDLDLESLLDSKSSQYDVRALAPKLNFDTTATGIIPILKAQGVNKVFDRELSEMDKLVIEESDETTYISDILQKCKIELDEEGTKAAAVTAIMDTTDSCSVMEPREVKEVYLDRPFAFMIYDSVNGKVVFLGKVTEL